MYRVLLLLLTALCLSASAQTKRISLSGTWRFALDRQQTLKPTDVLEETVTLPGTTDTNKKGDAATNTQETTHLTRHLSYKGRAWYQREIVIPASWRGQSVYLFLERTKPSEVYLDGNRLLGTVPFDHVRVMEGEHTLSLVNQDKFGGSGLGFHLC